MADSGTPNTDRDHSAALGRRYLVQFEEDTLRERPLWIRVIVEFIGTAVLVTVAAGAGVINHYAGDTLVSRAAAVIVPGAAVMAMIYAWGPLSGLHINPAVTFAFAGRQVFPLAWVIPFWGSAIRRRDRGRLVPSGSVWARQRRRELPDLHAWRRLEVAGHGDRTGSFW